MTTTKQPLIGSGFYATQNDWDEKTDFQFIWSNNVGNRDVVIVDNSESVSGSFLKGENIRTIRLDANLGHVGSFIGQDAPHLLGWSLSWIIPALIAYSENRDFIYFEQDALAFGDWEQSILDDAKAKNLFMAFGKGSPLACIEQSLFWIHHDFITHAVAMYMGIKAGDGARLPENKFQMMSEQDPRIGTFDMPCGRNRPLPYDLKTFYSQKFSADELDELKKMGFI